MLDNDRDVAGERLTFGPAQALDLLGHVVPVDRRIPPGIGRRAQSTSLRFAPKHKILVVEAVHSATLPPPGTGGEVVTRPPRSPHPPRTHRALQAWRTPGSGR